MTLRVRCNLLVVRESHAGIALVGGSAAPRIRAADRWIAEEVTMNVKVGVLLCDGGGVEFAGLSEIPPECKLLLW